MKTFAAGLLIAFVLGGATLVALSQFEINAASRSPDSVRLQAEDKG